MHRKLAQEEPDRADHHHERTLHYHEAAYELNPDDPYLRYLLAKAHLHFGDPAKARELFVQVSNMTPDSYYGKAAAKLAKAGQSNLKKPLEESP